MYQQIHSLSTKQQVETITKRLVTINSINGTNGEIEIVEELYRMLRTFPYFHSEPAHLWLQKIPNDPIGRKNLFAFIKGNGESNKTIIYHSHIDTVGIDDFGLLKDKAFSPDALRVYFTTHHADPDVQRDAQSGDWMFGRGAVDMKSGAAVHVANVLYFSEHPEELNGNLLLMINGDEESEHHGITGALSELERIQHEQGVEYLLAINTDFITPLYDGDETKYIYTGTAGKILPCFHIYGREVHVGDTLAGIDPNFIAAKITERIHNNYRLTEKIDGELILPPSCLYQRDTKRFYTVQTAPSSQIYFNYFLYESTPEEVLKQLVRETKQVCLEVEGYLREQFEQFLNKTGLPARDLSWEIKVTTYAEYIRELQDRGINPRPAIESVLNRRTTSDLRELSFSIVSVLQDLDPDKRARVIIFFAPPFLPHNYLKETETNDNHIKAVIEGVLANAQEETSETFAIKKFFPYLADGSFLSIHETEDQLNPLLENLPEWSTLYPVPFQSIKNLNIPSINMGVYGKDGHKWTERVYMPYSFQVLPNLIRKATVSFMNMYAPV
ncbi:M20/M25/M40 family metallo-hydrolase [Virgibacillus dakarensis]|uniref:M20/M25/M40 family metallo-hydrolase n=1 Tax=Virgibacillus dakarensis TaxID=1917889 RepID=UPI000B441479|nr:M20/M25/M40 family metallo-hydrolase [Virgibacillus dakarensis]MBT2215573.1 M20/M25/M40 family metallo-hydrolase [Virgibacillus dakarensis]